MSEPSRPRVSLSTQVILALVLGVLAGIFLGEKATALDVVGSAFIRLLQMVVIPYVLVSLIAGLGRLTYPEVRNLALRGGTVLLAMWAVVLVFVALVPLSFPEWESGSFFSTSLVEEQKPFDFLGLYVPDNPFFALGHGFVPAVVLFACTIGVALIGVPNKEPLIDQLDTITDALMRVANFVAGLAPYGVFALIASTAGTLGLAELQRLQVFLWSQIAMVLLLSFWVLPALVSVLTPIRYREIMGPSRDALVTAFATGNLLVVLPILSRVGKDLVERHSAQAEEASAAVDVVVPVSFNFPSLGKLAALGFVPFAAWFSQTTIPLSQYPSFLVTGTLTFFGTTVAAVPFLLDLFRIPADLFQLFVTVDVVTGRFGVTLAAVHTLVLALLGAFALTGGLTIRWMALGRWFATSLALTAAVFIGIRLVFTHVITLESDAYRTFMQMELVGERVPEQRPGTRNARRWPFGGEDRSRLARVVERGALRVCYAPEALPYAFVNEAGRLVGFDVDMAHALARDMGVGADFRRVARSNLASSLDEGHCDVAMTGLALTTERARAMSFSDPYLDEALAFLVRDHDRQRFATWESIQSLESPRIGVPELRHYVDLLRERLPDAELVTVSTIRKFLRGESGDLDALLHGAGAGSAWTLVYPRFAVAVPRPHPIAVPVAYAMPHGERELVEFVNTFIQLRKRDRTIERFYDHWILGKPPSGSEPRWSVIRDVLHWTD